MKKGKLHIRTSANSIEGRQRTEIEGNFDKKATIIHHKQKSSHDAQETRSIYQSMRKAKKTYASCSSGSGIHRPASSLGVIDNSIGKEFKNIDLSAYEKQKKTMNQLNNMAKKISIKEKGIFAEEETGKEMEESKTLFSIDEDLSSSDCSKSNTTIVHFGSKHSTPSDEVGKKYAASIVKQSSRGVDSHSKISFQPKCTLKAHLDCCRDLLFTSDYNYLASVSEDCLLKIWKTDEILKSDSYHSILPYFTFRGHTGSLFTLSASHFRKGNTDAELIYTAGLEGVIRVWGIPNYEIDPYQKTNGKNYCIGVWASHKDVVWQLVHHPTDVRLSPRIYYYRRVLMELSNYGRSLISV